MDLRQQLQQVSASLIKKDLEQKAALVEIELTILMSHQVQEEFQLYINHFSVKRTCLIFVLA